MMKKTLILFMLLVTAMAVQAQNVENPVIKGVADCGCFRWAGKYYLGGVATYGDFFVSDNLVDWPERIHVFDLDNDWTHGTDAKNNQVHADDICYANGKFHLLFSVNHWGKERHIVHITHAESPTIDGTYTEKRSDQWMENRIDPQIFRDDDGKLYLYMVKFTDGNAIWVRPMAQDFSFDGDAMLCFSSQRGTWETMDNRVAEGPFVVKHHNRYYMMYNANHTGVEFGNYRLGVCESSSPLMFNAGGKYPQPVVAPETQRISDLYADLLTYGTGRYIPIDLTKETITFTLSQPLKHKAYMKVAQRGGITIELNGKQINPEGRAQYEIYAIDKKLLKKGENTIKVIKPADAAKAHLVALALYDTEEDLAGEMLLTPGQPNILRGPNGFEWWLSYMANVAWSRHQFVDRVHFNGGRMTVDGITDTFSPGTHPKPAMPNYGGKSLADVKFSSSYLLELTMKSSCKCGGGIVVGNKTVKLPAILGKDEVHLWRIEKDGRCLSVWVDGVLVEDAVHVQGSNEVKLCGKTSDYTIDYVTYTEGFDRWGKRFYEWESLATTDEGMKLTDGSFLHCQKHENYELSVGLANLPLTGISNTGVYAAYTDRENYVLATVNSEKQALVVTECKKGKSTSSEYPLQETVTHYPDLKNTDSFEKQYRFDQPTLVSAIDLPHLDASHDNYAQDLSIKNGETLYRDDMAAMFRIQYLDGRTWKDLTYQQAESENVEWQRIGFAPVATTGIRFINAEPTDHDRHIYRIKTTRDHKSAYQLRVRKENGQIKIYVDSREITTIPAQSGASQIGLYSDSDKAVLVRDMLYYSL